MRVRGSREGYAIRSAASASSSSSFIGTALLEEVRGMRGLISRDRPKSQMRMSQEAVTRMLAGLRSRCTMFAPCR